ncbi:MAG: ATP-binding cassette domain-containing protein, partial [Sphaerochaetaceae bacterium]
SGSVVKSESEEGPVSYLFQEPRLLPWFSVLTNVELVLRPFYESHKQRLDVAMKFIKMVGLGEYAKLKPEQLSGGMRQRVAIARSFAYPGHLMLLDEPFQSLDYSLRWQLVHSFLNLWYNDKRTTLYVTHDIQEALLMADQVVKLSKRPMKIVATHQIESHKRTRKPSDEKLIALQAAFYN